MSRCSPVPLIELDIRHDFDSSASTLIPFIGWPRAQDTPPQRWNRELLSAFYKRPISSFLIWHSRHLAGHCVTMRSGASSTTLGGMLAPPLSRTSWKYRRMTSGTVSVFCDPQTEKFTFERSIRPYTIAWSVVPKKSQGFPESLSLGSLVLVRFGFPDQCPYLKPSTPSIGKSYFAVYALLRRLAAGHSVMFNNKHEETYLFQEQGVWMRPTTSIQHRDLLRIPYDPAHRVWALFDPSNKKEAIGGPLTSNKKVFFAIFASPDPARFKDLVENDGAYRWLLSPWDDNELRYLYVSLIVSGLCVWLTVLPGLRQKEC